MTGGDDRRHLHRWTGPAGKVTIVRVPDLLTALAYGRQYAEATTPDLEARPFLGDVADRSVG